LVIVSIVVDACFVNELCLGLFLIKGRVHHHDAEAGFHPHFKKKTQQYFYDRS
jgi:hypothetical protein